MIWVAIFILISYIPLTIVVINKPDLKIADFIGFLIYIVPPFFLSIYIIIDVIMKARGV